MCLGLALPRPNLRGGGWVAIVARTLKIFRTMALPDNLPGGSEGRLDMADHG